mgnify:CR=1 FL=1
MIEDTCESLGSKFNNKYFFISVITIGTLYNITVYKFKSVSPSNESPIKRYLVLPVELGLPIT